MPAKKQPTQLEEKQRKIEELEIRLAEAEETLRAIREGEVDAVVVSGTRGDQIFSLVGTDSIYRLIVETMKEAAFTVTFDGTILFCNAQFGELVKRPLEVIVGHPLHEFVEEGQRASATSLLVSAQRKPAKTRLVFQDLNHASVPTFVSANVLNQPDNLSICVVASDLSELENSTELLQQLRRQQEMLRESEEQLALAASGTRIGIFDRNLITGEIKATEQNVRLIALRTTTTTTTTTTTLSQEYHYRDWAQRVHPEDLAQVETEMKRCMDKHAPFEAEYRVVWPDGTTHWIAERGVFQDDGQGTPSRHLGILMDITARKQAEEALRESEERFRVAQELSPDGFSILRPVRDSEGRIVDFTFVYENAAIARINGTDPAAVVGRRISEFLPAHSQSPFHQAHAHVADTGETCIMEQKYDGGDIPRPTWFRVVVVRTGQDIAILSQDITERKRAEESLRENEAKFRSLFENSPDAIFLAIPGGAITQANPAACAIFGRTEVDLCEIGRQGIEDPADPTPAGALTERARTGKVRYEATHVRKNGTRFPSEVSSVIVDGGRRSIVILRDITERKRAEEALCDSEERFRALYQHSIDAIIVSDPCHGGRVLAANPAASTLFGWSEAELMGKTREELFDLNDPAFGTLMQTRQNVGIARGELTYRCKSGITFPGEVSTALFADAHGAPRTVAIIRDITERKRAEEALRGAVTELERSNKDLEQFAYVSSHDLQEPLRMVTAFAGMLRDRYGNQLDEKANQYLGFAIEGAERMQVLVGDLLEYSRVRSKAQEPVSTKADASLGAALANLQESIKESGAKVTHDPLPVVIADGLRLTQVFQNLIANAIKFRRTEATPEVHVGCRRDDKEWVFSVNDNGIGIEPQYADRIFEIFERLHTREEYPGTGVGLAICRKIVERHSGRIWVESEPGKGSTFFFTLPHG